MTSWTVRDIWYGIGYEPSAGVQNIHDELELTDRGQRIFRGARPALEESEAFTATVIILRWRCLVVMRMGRSMFMRLRIRI